MTDQSNPGDKGLRILLEALTTISYLKREDGRAAAIAEYALDQYENAIRHAGASEGFYEGPYLPGLHPEQRVCPPRRRADRRHANCELPVDVVERRLNADRRVNPDRRCQSPANR
jgi:hypothetical protein